jgi:hypothetical protein
MKRALGIIIVVALSVSGVSAAITAQLMAPSKEECPHDYTPGYTRTLEMTWIDLDHLAPYLEVLNSDSVRNQWLDSQGNPVNWRYDAGSSSITGTLNVTRYLPFDDPPGPGTTCDHYCELTMTLENYNGIAGQQFNWLQYYSGSGDWFNASNVVDPPQGRRFDNDLTGDALPFYPQSTPPRDFCGGLGSLEFGDWPGTYGIFDGTTHAGRGDFVTFLTSWDGTDPVHPYDVNVYGAVTWGFDFACIPEPSSVVPLICLIASSCSFRARSFRIAA